MSYNYFDAMNDDVMEYIGNEVNLAEWKGRRFELEEYLSDVLWIEDSVTGNGSGSYTFSRAIAKEYVLENIDELLQAIEDFCIDAETVGRKFLEEDWEYFDVSIRCSLLGQVISSVLDDLENELNDDKEAEDGTQN